jgi:hypothetical protein
MLPSSATLAIPNGENDGRRPRPGRRRGHLLAVVAMILALAAMNGPVAAAQRSVPLPRPRPEAAGPPAAPENVPAQKREEPVPEPKSPAAEQADACLSRLRAAGVEFDIPAMPVAANAACEIEAPVRLKSVRGHSRADAPLRLTEEPVLSCRFAERLAGWLGDLAVPLIVGRLSTEVKAVRTGPGYDCRNRNRAAGGKLSAHAVGQAVDISGFELANGKALRIKPDGDDGMRAAVDALRTAACGWFTTVLGPGSDAAHTDHMHVDIMVHGSSDRYRICQ